MCVCVCWMCLFFGERYRHEPTCTHTHTHTHLYIYMSVFSTLISLSPPPPHTPPIPHHPPIPHSTNCCSTNPSYILVWRHFGCNFPMHTTRYASNCVCNWDIQTNYLLFTYIAPPKAPRRSPSPWLLGVSPRHSFSSLSSYMHTPSLFVKWQGQCMPLW